MSKKFTEEEYKEIVYMFTVAGDSEEETRLVAEYVSSIKHSSDYYEALAIANPITREWAHKQFVEKEKKYYWTTKKKNKKGKPMTLFNSAGGIAQMTGAKHALTESEIREWGYNPEMFDREEV